VMVIDIYETVRVVGELGQLCEEGHRYMKPCELWDSHRYMKPCELWGNSASYEEGHRYM